MAAVGLEFLVQIGIAQGVFCPAFEEGLAFFQNTAVAQVHTHMPCELTRVGVRRIHHVAHFARECAQIFALDCGLGVSRQARIVQQQTCRNGIGNAELGRVRVRGRGLQCKRLPKPVHDAFGGFAFNALDLLGSHPLLAQSACTVDVGMGHGAAGVRFESNRGPDPTLAKTRQQGFKVTV